MRSTKPLATFPHVALTMVAALASMAPSCPGEVCEPGAPDCTTCVNDVEASFARQNTSYASHMHGRLGPSVFSYRNHQVNHNQGIGRLYSGDGRYMVLSRSMRGHGQLLMFRLDGYSPTRWELGSAGSHSSNNRVVWQFNDEFDRNHPDGLSVMGNYFVHGISCEGGDKCDRDQDMPRVYVWDATNPGSPRKVLDFDLVQLGASNSTANAGATAMVKLANGLYLIVVKSKRGSERVVRFLVGPSLTDQDSWSQVTVLPESQIEAWDDDDFNYQHMTAVTECGSQKVYLVATKGTWWSFLSSNGNVARLYEVHFDDGSFSLVKRGHRYFRSQSGVHFGATAGVYVSPDHRMNFYTSESEYHGTSSGYKVKLREFWHR